MRRTTPLVLALPAVLAGLAFAPRADAAPTIDDYRHFRALSLDLLGRIPTRAEIAAFEKDGFDLDGWITAQIKGPAYVDRLSQIYSDLLRLQITPNVQFVPQPVTLRRETIMGPNGKDLYVYFRSGQRRTRDLTDGVFCLTADETGYQFPRNAAPVPYAVTPPHPVKQADLDANTVVIKPWWLYGDYKSKTPQDLYDPATWVNKHPGYVPVPTLLVDADLTTPTTAIRICKEEAQTADAGTIYAPAHAKNQVPGGRLEALPVDSGYATAHKGEAVSCSTQLGGSTATDCGCGVGLERCMPGDGPGFSPKAFTFSSQVPLGIDQPIDATGQAVSNWTHAWWGEEASQFLGYIFSQDRDFREVLTGHYTLVNGPLTQFYRSVAPTTCCGNAVYLGYAQPQPLFDPAALPTDLSPHDALKWELVKDRGKLASGILTLPAFLVKFGSRRARAHVLYNAFKCQDFVAGNIQLKPSTESNLMVRDGCSTCHVSLEPMSAYFSRVMENDWTYLPAAQFPTLNPACKIAKAGAKPPGQCASYYDPAFTDTDNGVLRGAYPDVYADGKYASVVTQHADEGPAGLAAELTSDPVFPGCVAQNIAVALLGRQLTPDDAGYREALAQAFVQGGYKMSALVTAVVKSDRYRSSNNWTSTHLRSEVSQ